MAYKIPLKSRLYITYYKPEDRVKAEALVILVEKKLKNSKYEKRINDILVEAGQDCLEGLKVSSPQLG